MIDFLNEVLGTYLGNSKQKIFLTVFQFLKNQHKAILLTITFLFLFNFQHSFCFYWELIQDHSCSGYSDGSKPNVFILKTSGLDIISIMHKMWRIMTTFNQANFCSHFFEYRTLTRLFGVQLITKFLDTPKTFRVSNNSQLHVENEERIKKLFDFDWLFLRVREIDSYIVRT